MDLLAAAAPPFLVEVAVLIVARAIVIYMNAGALKFPMGVVGDRVMKSPPTAALDVAPDEAGVSVPV